MVGTTQLAIAGFLLSPGAASVATPSMHVDRPHVNVWLNHDTPYSRGQDVRVYLRTDDDAYLTIVRIDTDGRMRVLFPVEPWEDNFTRGHRTFEVLGRTRDPAFQVDDYPGVGYVFAIASYQPFDYDDLARGDRWDYRAVSDGRVRGDPYVALADFAQQISRGGDYDYDVAEYYVERHYDYPRFVCYDCHSYVGYSNWDPYSTYCSRFRLVVYDDPYYYPYRSYRSRDVVIVRPARPAPRYVFKDYDGRGDYITRIRERPRGSESRRPDDRERTSSDVGGRGTIPAPRLSPGSDRESTPPSAEPRRRAEPESERPSPEPGRRGAKPGKQPARPDGAEPRRERPQGKSGPPPRSTGEPELKRRRPGS